MRLLTDAETTCDFMIAQVKAEETPKLWWKYTVKAAYLRVV